MSLYETISHLSNSELALAISAVAGVIVSIATFLEKIFKSPVFSWVSWGAVWKVVKFFGNWLIYPIKPKIDSIHKTISRPGEIEKRFETLLEHDEGQNTLLGKIEESVLNIERELKFNGGSTIRDTVEKLVKRDGEKWEILMALHDFQKELHLRMDISDESDNRMSFKLGTNKQCIYISENFLRFFGYTPNDILGSDWEFCISAKYLTGVRSGWKKAFERKTVYRNEQIIIDSDAGEHLCLVKAYPLTNRDGEFRGFYGIVEVLESLDE